MERNANKRSTPIDQVAALPYFIDREGVARVLLITSRRTRRWVVPKGNPICGLAPHEAAAQEAWEEAGLIGTSDPTSLGRFRYQKRLGFTSVEASVELFPFRVSEQLKDWPERKQRDVKWFGLDEAARLVGDPELAPLIAGFKPPESSSIVDRSAPLFRARTTGRLALMDWFRSLMRR